MTILAGPRGWHAGKVEHREQRFADTTAIPLSYDEATRSVTATLSKGSPVARFYGREVLAIDARNVNLDRVDRGGVPLLDSHNQVGIGNMLGKVQRVWFLDGALMGRLKFNETPQGETAMGMVERGEVGAVSIGYKVTEWDIEDASGNSVDPEDMRWDDDLTFIASQWELLEASLVCVPADNLATIRSLGSNDFISDIRSRMYARQEVTDIRARMMSRQAMYDRQSEMLGNYDD